ncbi:MAG: hypothetical protein ACTSU2_05715 [Promethearchaeota archaeon]
MPIGDSPYNLYQLTFYGVIAIVIVVLGDIFLSLRFFKNKYKNVIMNNNNNDNKNNNKNNKNNANKGHQENKINENIPKRHVFQYNKLIIFIIPLIFGLLTAFSFFRAHNLFNMKIITHNDYSFHYYFSWYFNNYLMSEFKSSYGFSNYFYAGHPIVTFYSSGMYYLQYILWRLGINVELSIRLIIFLIILAYFFVPSMLINNTSNNKLFRFKNIFSKRFEPSDIKSHEKIKNVAQPFRNRIMPIYTLFSTLSLFFMSIWLRILDFGLYPYMLSVILTFYLISDFEKRILTHKKIEYLSNTSVKHFFILICIANLHFTSIIVFFIYMVIVILNQIFFKYKDITEFLSFLKLALIYSVFAFISVSLYLIPNIFETRHVFLPNDDLINMKDYSRLIFIVTSTLAIRFLLGLSMVSFFYILPGLILYLRYRRKNKSSLLLNVQSNKNTNNTNSNGIFGVLAIILKEPNQNKSKYLNYLILMLLFFIIITGGLILYAIGFEIINYISPMRFIAYIIPLASVFIGLFLTHIYSMFFENFKSIQLNIKTSFRKFYKRHLLNLKAILILSNFVIFFSAVLYNAYDFGIVPTIYTEHEYEHNTNFLGNLKFRMNDLDYTDLPQNVSEVFNWIGQHSSKDYRILVEESGLFTDFKWGGYTLALLPTLYPNSSFIGGYYQIFGAFYRKVFNATAYESNIFGIGVSNTTVFSSIKSKLDDFNIKYIICWSEDLRGFIMANPDKFKVVTQIDNFTIAEYVDAIESYITSNNSYVNFSNILIRQNQISFDIHNASRNDIIRVSLQNYFNWHIYLNGCLIKPYNTDLIRFSVENNGNYHVDIIWVKSPVEKIAELTELIGIALVPILLLKNFKFKSYKFFKKEI